MLKIYNIMYVKGDIKLYDYINFEYGRFDTGSNGFGDVLSTYNVLLPSKIINYDRVSKENYKELTRELAQLKDGFVTNFYLNQPLSYRDLEKQFGHIEKTEEEYEKYHLNEEGILLFTNGINITSENPKLVERIFGRHVENSLYLLEPGASLIVSPSISSSELSSSTDTYNYEVLQSNTLGKRLILQKMDRKI